MILNPFNNSNSKKSELYNTRNSQQFYQKILISLNPRIKNSDKLTPTVQPDCIVQFLQDWFSKLIKDGYQIQKILQIIHENSYAYSNKIWLQRFLITSNNHLQKRCLKPRLCLPRMYIDKDINQVKNMLKKTHLFLENNQKIINIVMRNGYSWTNKGWDDIYEEVIRNRYECKKICVKNCENLDETIGILFWNDKMKDMQKYYGECLYILHYRAVLPEAVQVNKKASSNQTKQQQYPKQQIMRHVLLVLVCTQFALPVITSKCIYQTKRNKPFQIQNTMKQAQINQQKISQHQYKFKFYPQTQAVDRSIIQSIIQLSIYKPFHVVHLVIQINQAQNAKNANKNYYSKNIQTTKHKRTTITYAIMTTCKNFNQKPNMQLPNIFIGLFNQNSSDPLAQIFNKINKILTNNSQYPIQLIIQRITDRCKIITILLKISNILLQQSLTKRQPAIQIIWSNDNLPLSLQQQICQQQQYLNQQVNIFKQNIYSKNVVFMLIDTIKKSNIGSYQNFQLIKQKDQPRKLICFISCIKQKSEQKIKVAFNVVQNRWQCQCMYLQHTGLPCIHLTKTIIKFKGDILYYINDRWKNPYPAQNQKTISNKNKNLRYRNRTGQNQGCPVTNNKGLLRLISVFKSMNCV